MTYQNLWDRRKVVLRESLLTVNAYIRKIEQSLTNNLMMHLKVLDKQK